jgi:hypothetical protein
MAILLSTSGQRLNDDKVLETLTEEPLTHLIKVGDLLPLTANTDWLAERGVELVRATLDRPGFLRLGRDELERVAATVRRQKAPRVAPHSASFMLSRGVLELRGEDGID